MKYSEDIVKRQREMHDEVMTVRGIAKDAPVGQLLRLMDEIHEELLLWESHEDYTKEELVGLVMMKMLKQEEV